MQFGFPVWAQVKIILNKILLYHHQQSEHELKIVLNHCSTYGNKYVMQKRDEGKQWKK